MSDWMFDDGSATSLLGQGYGTGAPPPVWDEPTPQGAPSEDPLFSEDLPDGGEVDPITVTPGHQPGPPIDGAGWGGTDTTWLDPDAPPEDLPCTPPPDGPTPVGVDMNELRRKARDLANDASGEDNDVEWGGLIWQAPDGSLHVTSLRTSGSDETAAFALGEVGPGGRIVATFHTHPERNDTVNQGVLNADDRNIVIDLQAAIDDLGLDVTIDANAMMYVTDNEHGVTKEFDVNDPRNAYGTVLGPCGSQ